MSFRRWFLAALAVSSASLPAVHAGNVQKPGLTLPANASIQQDAVKQIFNTSYTAYKQYAWGHDDLAPVDETYVDGLGGWGASIADALGTMDWFEEAIDYVGTINFNQSKTPDTVSVFETTIRYVGGFISAYELSGQKYPILVQKAQEVADKMVYGFVGSNVAQAGSLTLEWGLLSQYTKNDTYSTLATNSVLHMIGLADPIAGIPAQGIDPATGESVGSYVTWGGGTDSYLEYLIKYARLTNTNDTTYADAWATAVDSSIQKLLRNSTVDDWLYLADFDGTNILHVGSHLACFYGGNWILGGALLNNQTIIDYGLQLTDACMNTYASTATQIGPETFAYMSSDGNATGTTPPDAAQLAFYNEHGFYITTADYILRPEVLESNFYAWRVSGDQKYLDNAAKAIQSFEKYLPTTVAYTGINDVNQVNSTKTNDMESFWFAEVLKYLYLTFDDPNNISLDDWVFNTECHPFKAPTALPVYGSGNLIQNSQPFASQSGSLPQVSPTHS
ncbi:glycoside hydrolase family 47 protein [Serpula lacrymans var. lacrymans S7.9]|uniref:alpha-1,2-Mannosidase n=1 Tax=Serpula lacrymans var. lacrymans (strain S7.9) TaxID=578457 RepID=F8NH73_SERL9|nr:glycoside hydrolase family 47 protein [Serpula lacrymans var. lacrymans S7.9]EGO29662.1 glycoside hydrolase family 47 protein [Serpula lacrymans var. lacrymans S7.9]